MYFLSFPSSDQSDLVVRGSDWTPRNARHQEYGLVLTNKLKQPEVHEIR